jgi:hypothetical protein
MNRFAVLTLAAALFTLALAAAPARAQQRPTETSFVRAWEDVQKGDPETVTFEKVGERRYRFKTERFPFDGELRVLKATVDESAGAYGEDEGGLLMSATGVVEYELIGLSDEVRKKYEHSFSLWERNNRLFFDRERGEWLSSGQYVARMSEKSQEMLRAQERREQNGMTAAFWLRLALTWGPLLGLGGFFVWIMKRSGLKNQRQYMNMAALHMQRADEQMQRSQAHMERAEELLQRIATAVEESSGRAKQ